MPSLSEILKDLTPEERFRKLINGFLQYVIEDKDERKTWRIWHALSMRMDWSEKCKLLGPWFDGDKDLLKKEVEKLLVKKEKDGVWDYLSH